MHRDKRLGLSLAILLIGIVGAFFFRNDVEPAAPAPSLEDPDILDDRIAEHSVTPYLTGIETEETDTADRLEGYRPARPEDQPTAVVEPTEVTPVKQSAASSGWELPSFLKEPFEQNPPAQRESTEGSDRKTRQQTAHQRNTHRQNAIVPSVEAIPKPIQLKSEHGKANAELVAQPAPNHNNAWEPVDRPDTKTVARQAETEFLIHKVMPGETLSGLAARYLGSPNRYREIFSVNRDLLKNPDDVQVGIRLKIPVQKEHRRRSIGGKAGEASRPDANLADQAGGRMDASPASQKGTSKKNRSSRSVSPKSRFLPAPRGSLFRSTQKGLDESETQAATRGKGKQLSQIPPFNVPIVDDDRAGFATSAETLRE